MISCFESRHVAQNNSVINFAMIVLVGLQFHVDQCVQLPLTPPSSFPSHSSFALVPITNVIRRLTFCFGLDLRYTVRTKTAIWFDVVQVPSLCSSTFYFVCPFGPAVWFSLRFLFFFWCHVFNSSSMPDHCCRLNFTRNKFSHCLPKVLSWMAVVLHRVRLPQQQRQPIQLVSCSQQRNVQWMCSRHCCGFPFYNNFLHFFFWKDHGKIVLQIKC